MKHKADEFTPDEGFWICCLCAMICGFLSTTTSDPDWVKPWLGLGVINAVVALFCWGMSEDDNE